MVCATPPQPDDTRLLSFLDGEIDLTVQAHIEQCPYCRQRATQLAALQGRLLAGLYRAVCPTPDELGDYDLGLLPADQALAVTQHLAECPHCTREIAQLQAFLTDLSPAQETERARTGEPSLLELMRDRVQVLIAQLVPGGSGPALALAGVRGQEQDSRVYQAGGVEVVIGVQPDVAQPDRGSILGLVIGLTGAELQATLWQGNRQIAVALVDELDSFVLSSIAPGVYQLVLSGPDLELTIPNLEIGPLGAIKGADPQD
jgi:anti-sigma factor ChrR (cupin superfamily)